MNLLNTNRFDQLVKFYKLSHELQYFRLYNKSDYINSYHGYEHVKRIICSIYEISQNLNYVNIRNLMVAAIFHDFNYKGINKENKYYDESNILEALKAFDWYKDGFSYASEYHYTDTDFDKIKDLIDYSQYPRCMKLREQEKLPPLADLFINCDHSMIIHEGYEYMALMFSLNEYRSELDKQLLLDNATTYFNKVYFTIPKFQNIWGCNKETIIHKYKDYISYLSPQALRSIRENRNNPGYVYYHTFEIIQPNF